VTNRKYLGEVVHKGQSYPGEHEAILDRRLWDEAQRIMVDNYHARATKTRQKAPALLTGIIRCGHCGTAIGASHTKRRGRRYRYYVCNHAQKNGYDTCPVKSVAAGQAEGIVKDRIRVILRSPDMIARTFREVQAQAEGQREDLAGQKERLEAKLADLKRAIGRLARSDGNDGGLVAELGKLNEEYGQTQNQVEAVGHALEALGADGPAEGAGGRVVSGKDGQTVDVRVPMEFKTRSGRKEIILPPGAATTADVGPRSPLVVALARAYRWQRMIDTGEVKSLDALASANGVNRSYIGRILNLAGMAPDIIQAILQGREPSGLSLQTLTRDLPAQWGQQRTALGVSG